MNFRRVTHIADVVRVRNKSTNISPIIDVEEPENSQGDATSDLVAALLLNPNGESDSVLEIEKMLDQSHMKKLKLLQHDISSPNTVPYSYDDIEEGEVIHTGRRIRRAFAGRDCG